MNKTIRWGILATGGIARVQMADMRVNKSDVQAVGSRSIESARTFAEEFKIPYSYGSYKELCNSDKVDVIYIASPHSHHHEHALLALRGGKHILVEKAFTLNCSQAEDIFALARERGLFVMEAMWSIHLPSMQKVLEIITSGGIGSPRLLLADHNQYLPKIIAPRLYDLGLGGGALLDLGVYPISFARMIFGDPVEVSAQGTLNIEGSDEMTGMVFRYKDGAQAVMHCGALTPGPNRAVIVGDKGRIDMDGYWYNQTGFSHYGQDGKLKYRYDEKIEGRGMHFQIREVENCLEHGLLESPAVPAEHTLSVMRTMDIIRKQTGVKYPCEE